MDIIKGDRALIPARQGLGKERVEVCEVGRAHAVVRRLSDQKRVTVPLGQLQVDEAWKAVASHPPPPSTFRLKFGDIVRMRRA